MNSANPAPKRTASEIFSGALDLPDPAELKAYLDRECQGDAALRAQVEILMAHHHSDSFLEHPALAGVAAEETPTTSNLAINSSLERRFLLHIVSSYLEPIGVVIFLRSPTR